MSDGVGRHADQAIVSFKPSLRSPVVAMADPWNVWCTETSIFSHCFIFAITCTKISCASVTLKPDPLFLHTWRLFYGRNVLFTFSKLASKMTLYFHSHGDNGMQLATHAHEVCLIPPEQ